MRSLALVVLLIANALFAFFFTYPRYRETVALAKRRVELDQVLEARRREIATWNAAVHSLDKIAARLQKLFGDRSSAVPRLRLALLDLEKGLPVVRTSAEYRSEGEARDGFRRYKIKLTLRGDFEDLYAYLEKASRLRAPLAPVDVSLTPGNAEEAALVLNISWTAVWPEMAP